MRKPMIWCVILVLYLAGGCSRDYSGGTTDTGNARVAARIHTIGGERAAGASVTVCPADYQVLTDDGMSKVVRTVTDDSGYFEIDTLEPGNFFIEVNDGAASAVLLKVTISEDRTSTVTITDTLELYSSISGNAGPVQDTLLRRYLVIDGLNRKISVAKNGQFELSDLPAGTYDLTVAAETSDWQPLRFNKVATFADSTVRVGDFSAADTTVITFNTTLSGAGVNGNILNFPVLVRLTDECRFPGSLQVNKRDGTALPHTVASVDGAGCPATLWVLIDTLFGNRSDQSVVLVARLTDSAPGRSSGTVFDSSKSFTACYHFDGTTEDASVNHYNGTNHGSLDTSGGIIGRARAFDGSAAYISLGDLPDRRKGTISFWFKPKGYIGGYLDKTQGIWGKKCDDWVNSTLSLQGSDFYSGSGFPGRLITKMEDSTDGFYLSSTTESFSHEMWYHAAWVWGDGSDSLYINGKLESTSKNNLMLTGDGAEEIGRSSYDISNIAGYQQRYFSGLLDEFRIDHTARSAEWIKLCFNNQSADDKLVKVSRMSNR